MLVDSRHVDCQYLEQIFQEYHPLSLRGTTISIILIANWGPQAIISININYRFGRTGWRLRFDRCGLVDIRIADFDFNGKYLKLRCANVYFKSLFYLHDYFTTKTNSNLKA